MKELPPAAVDTLSKQDLIASQILVAALIIAVGIFLLISRWLLEGSAARKSQSNSPSDSDRTLIRGWLSSILVSGMLLFAVSSLFMDDETLRSLLMGGIIASAGTATAFYFASKAAEQNQKNLLEAAFTSVNTFALPDLAGKPVAQARTIAEALSLKLDTAPKGADDANTIVSTTPPKGAAVKPGDTVVAVIITVPDVSGSKVKDAQQQIENLQLKVERAPQTADDNDTVTSIDPAAGTPMTIGQTVTVHTT